MTPAGCTGSLQFTVTGNLLPGGPLAEVQVSSCQCYCNHDATRSARGHWQLAALPVSRPDCMYPIMMSEIELSRGAHTDNQTGPLGVRSFCFPRGEG